MPSWFPAALGAALLYGLHQVFTKLAATRISDGLGGIVVESTAALTIGIYLLGLLVAGRWAQHASAPGVAWAAVTGICVGAGTILFFVLFQKGAPLSAVPGILAAGTALMAVIGILFFRESAAPSRLLGIALSVAGLYLLR